MQGNFFLTEVQTIYVNIPTSRRGGLNLLESLSHVWARLKDFPPEDRHRKGKVVASHSGESGKHQLNQVIRAGDMDVM